MSKQWQRYMCTWVCMFYEITCIMHNKFCMNTELISLTSRKYRGQHTCSSSKTRKHNIVEYKISKERARDHHGKFMLLQLLLMVVEQSTPWTVSYKLVLYNFFGSCFLGLLTFHCLENHSWWHLRTCLLVQQEFYQGMHPTKNNQWY